MDRSSQSSMPPGARPPGLKVLERLREERRVDQFEFQRVLEHAHRYSQRVEDSLVDTETFSEADLLRYLAQRYRTRFVTTDKLMRATIPFATLRLVPESLAHRIGVFPILFDQRTETLSVVAIDLEAFDVERQVSLVSGVRSVRVYVARPGAVLAAIAKHYRGDLFAFQRLGEHREAPTTLSPDAYDGLEDAGLSVDEEPISMSEGPGTPSSGPLALPPSPFVDEPPPYSGDLFGEVEDEVRRSDVRITNIPIPRVPEFGFTSQSGIDGRTPSLTTMGVTRDDYLESMNILVSLLELEREDLRGHTSQVARFVRKLCERIGVDADLTHGALVAAYLHDVGKVSTYHLTALNVAQYEGHQVQAKKSYLAPIRLFDGVALPDVAVRGLTHMYERPNGEGFPDGLTGNDIPLAARVLAVVETFVDLTQHAKNPYRRRLTPKQALKSLDQYKESIFDPTLVDVMRVLVLGDEVKAKLLADNRTVLVIEPNAEEATVLEMRLIEQGHRVVVARSAVDGSERVAEGGIDLIVTETELSPVDGFEFVAQLREDGLKVPVIFTTKRGDRASVNRGFEVGAIDYIVKPAPVDVIVAKVTQGLSQQRTPSASRGVSGSLREMALSDVIQILAHGRKSGRLTVRSGGKSGEVDFSEGQIFTARFGDEGGADAFCSMMAATDGEFALDPSVRPTERTITDSTEGLLLEAMRRIDEGLT